ncbi:MAG: hypothetical protein PHC64_07075 [Candidatus Gastranaerophilales bacterium]|nr:hypothetical protein [Candidatus Gastranaerophilales bacterium]
MDKEILKLKVESLVTLRTSIINTLIVLVGGIVSLLFLQNSLLKGILLFVGFFYFVIFISNLLNITNKIDRLLITGKDKQ